MTRNFVANDILTKLKSKDQVFGEMKNLCGVSCRGMFCAGGELTRDKKSKIRK